MFGVVVKGEIDLVMHKWYWTDAMAGAEWSTVPTHPFRDLRGATFCIKMLENIGDKGFPIEMQGMLFDPMGSYEVEEADETLFDED